MSVVAIVIAHAGGESPPWLELPPLHPILVNFTAALVPVSFASDLLGRAMRRETLRSAGWWTLLYAAVVTPFTAAAGWYWLRDMGDMDHGPMGIHKWLGTALAALLVAVVFWRWRLHRRAQYPGGAYLATVGVLVAALMMQGHLGGMMSFGAAEADHDSESATEADPAGHADEAPPSPAEGHGDHPHGQPAGDEGHHLHAGPAETAPADSPQWRDSIKLGEK